MIPCKFKDKTEIAELKTIFRNQLIAIDNQWFPPGCIETFSFNDTQGLYFAVIFKNCHGRTRNMLVHIESNACKESIDNFMDIIIAKLSQQSHTLSLTFFDQSIHGIYTTDKISKVLEATHKPPDMWWPHKLYSCPARVQPKDITLKEGFVMQPLTIEHAKLVVTVHCNPPPGPSFTQLMMLLEETLKFRPSFGIFKVDQLDNPVAWITMYDNIIFGGLHTLNEFRGNGFGRALVRKMMNFISDTCKDFVFGAAIDEKNVASTKLFLSEGFLNVEERNPMMLYFGQSMNIGFKIIQKSDSEDEH